MTERNDKTDFGRVAVLYGGDSAEREISLQTGEAVHTALRGAGVDAYRVDTREVPVTRLLEERYDRAFIALHGRGGEDGVIQGALETLRIPYTGSGVLGSALAMDKVRSKQVWQSAGIPTPSFMEIRDRSGLRLLAEGLDLPIMMKPVHEGSSCGAAKVTAFAGLEAAWETAARLDERVMAETWIEGVEYTCSVLQGRALPMIRLETPREFYDYEAKYLAETTCYHCPCGLDEERERELSRMMLEAFDAIGAGGWGRVDFMLDADGGPWLIEVNTIPGLTSHSLVPMAAKQAGMDFTELVLRILATSFHERATADLEGAA